MLALPRRHLLPLGIRADESNAAFRKADLSFAVNEIVKVFSASSDGDQQDARCPLLPFVKGAANESRLVNAVIGRVDEVYPPPISYWD